MNIAKRLINVLMVISIVFFLPFIYGSIVSKDGVLKIIMGSIPLIVLLLINYIFVGEFKLFHSVNKTSESENEETESQNDSNKILIEQLKVTIEKERLDHLENIMEVEANHLIALDNINKDNIEKQIVQSRIVQVYGEDIVKLLKNDEILAFAETSDDPNYHTKVALNKPLSKLEFYSLNEYIVEEDKRRRTQTLIDHVAKCHPLNDEQKHKLFEFIYTGKGKDNSIQDCIDYALTSELTTNIDTGK